MIQPIHIEILCGDYFLASCGNVSVVEGGNGSKQIRCNDTPLDVVAVKKRRYVWHVCHRVGQTLVVEILKSPK